MCFRVTVTSVHIFCMGQTADLQPCHVPMDAAIHITKNQTNGERNVRDEKRAPDGRRSASHRRYRGLAARWRLRRKVKGILPTRSRPRRTICGGFGTERPEGQRNRC